MANQHKCSVCSAPPDVLQFIEKEIGLKHAFMRIASKVAFSKSALHRHAQRCIPKRAALDHKNLRAPDFFDMHVTMPDGQTFLHEGDGEIYAFNRGLKTQKGLVEVEVSFEVAPRARIPHDLVITVPLETPIEIQAPPES